MKTLEQIYLTEEGWQKLRAELADLLKRRGAQASEFAEFAETIEWGQSPSPNVHSIAMLDRRIAELEEVLARGVPVRAEDREPGLVGIGSRVSVRWEDGEEESYTLVGPPEVDLPAGKISYESPVGRALMGRHQAEWVNVVTPAGPFDLELLRIE